MELQSLSDQLEGSEGMRKTNERNTRKSRCVFRAKVATNSTGKLPSIPRESCH
jgi:hypothetical protein